MTVTATGLPPGLSINSAQNIVGTISNTADVNSPYSVTLTATDGTYSNSQTFNWTVNHLLLTSPGDQTNYDGDVVSLQVAADDNLGDAVTYGSTGLPSGLNINTSTGLVSGTIAATADVNGPYTVTVTATGGGASSSQTFTWNVNNPISITPLFDQSDALGDVVSVAVSATTATSDALTYSATGLPPGVNINSSTGVISGTITNMASITTPYNVTVTASDGAISASAGFVWAVAHLTLTNPGDQTNASGDTVLLALTASDNAGDSLTYNATGLPTGLGVNVTTGVISGVIGLNADATGPYTVTATVTGGGYTASQTFTWNVAHILITDPGDQNNADNDAVSLQIGVTANNPGTFTYSQTGLPPGLTINSATGLISGTIGSTADLDGPYTVTVTASDANGNSASDTFFWSVTQLTLTNPGTQLNADGDTVTLALAATGPQGVALAYSAVGLPPGLTINTATGVISGLLSMTADAGGPYTVTVTASDGKGASSSQTFTWNVDQLILDDPADQIYAEGQSVTLPIIADDNDGTALTYTVSGLPDGLSLSGTSGGTSVSVNVAGGSNQNQVQIGGTVLASDAVTTYNVVLSVTDGLGRTATVAFLITIESYTVKFWFPDVVTGYLKKNGAVASLPDPVEAYATVSDVSRLPFITFKATGQADRFSWGQIHLDKVLSVISVAVKGQSASITPGDATLNAVDSGITKASVPVTVVVPAGIAKTHPVPANELVAPEKLTLNSETSPRELGATAPNAIEVTAYLVTQEISILDQFNKRLSAIYAGASVLEFIKGETNKSTSINQIIQVDADDHAFYYDPTGAWQRRYQTANPLKYYPIINLNTAAGEQSESKWEDVSSPDAPQPQPLLGPHSGLVNIGITIGGIKLNGTVLRQITVTQQGANALVFIKWPNG